METLRNLPTGVGYQMYRDSSRAVRSEEAGCTMCSVDYLGIPCILVHKQKDNSFMLRQNTGNLYTRILFNTENHEKYKVIKDK